MAQLREAALLRSLAARGVELVAAVRPGQEHDAIALVRACGDTGVRVLVWPMLADADGRWASTVNAERFARFAIDLLDALEAARAVPQGLALDLEPPIGRLRKLLRGSPAAITSAPHDGGDLQGVCDSARARGLEVLVAVVPLLLVDRDGWQRLLGTPLPHADVVSPMLYTSLAIGYSRGVLHRADVRGLLHACACACAEQFGTRASVSLGAVGTGALGDEQLLEGPWQLADDVALCRAAGIDDIALFDLGGVLRRGPTDRWLDALIDTPPAFAPPALTPRARLALQAARTIGQLGSWGRIRAPNRSATNR
jgi:hypothetical protein